MPEKMGGLDVILLTLLGATAQKNNQRLAILAAINAIAGTEVDSQLKHACMHALQRRDVPGSESAQVGEYLCLRRFIESVKPAFKRVSASHIDVLATSITDYGGI